MKKIDWNKWAVWEKTNKLIIGLISLILSGILFYYEAYSQLATWKYSPFTINEEDVRSLKFLIFLIIWIILYFLTNFILSPFFSYLAIKRKLLPVHFKYSFGIVKNDMIPAMKNMVTKNSLDENARMDKYIQPPIEYVNETVKGNKVPKFNADDTYQNVLFDDEIEYIVAITAENPNLWLDPTLCFYMTNCYAVSLLRHAKENIEKGNNVMVIKHYKDYKEKYAKNRADAIKFLMKMKETNKDMEDSGFQFVRFFLYDNEQKECCKSAVLPSLKASQDLFSTISFYILKESIQQKTNWQKFIKINNTIWDLFGDENKSQVLKTRKEKVIPEFLVLFYKDYLEIHTYLDGEHKKIDNKPGSENSVGEENFESLNKIRDLISFMATYEHSHGDDLKGMDQQERNGQYAFIDWVPNRNSVEDKSR